MADDSAPHIDLDLFWSRWGKLVEAWKGEDGETNISEVSNLWLLSGTASEDAPYRKTTSLQIWLLGYEFPSTLLILSPKKITVVASASKGKILQPIADSAAEHGVEFSILSRIKNDEQNRKLWEQAFDDIKEKKVGYFPKDKFEGKFVDECKAFLNSKDEKVQYVDVSAQIASVMASKDDSEQNNQVIAAKVSDKLMDYFTDSMYDIIDSGRKITHRKFAEQVEGRIEDSKLWKGFTSGIPGVTVEKSQADMAYLPIIQSGGQYDLRSSAEPDEERLKPGVVLCSIGVRYMYYGANVGRTFMIDADKDKNDNYSYLLELQKYACQKMKPGYELREFYLDIRNKVSQERPQLEQNFPKNLGFAMGIEFRESAYVISAKANRKFKEDMFICLSLGFSNIPDAKDSRKTYSLLLLDTIQVIDGESAKVVSQAPKTLSDIGFSYEDEEEKKPTRNGDSSPKKKAAAANASGSRSSAVLKAKLRTEYKGTDDTASALRSQHQKELFQRKHEEALEKYAGTEAPGAVEKKWKRFESYSRETQLPEQTSKLQVLVDPKRQTVILPINGFAVPFHINTIKSCVKQEEGDYTAIRIMFITPGQIAGKKEDTIFEDENASFIRAVSFRSTDTNRFAEIHRQINELKKTVQKLEKDRQEMADMVEQAKLVEDRSKRVLRLADTWLRPAFEGKRSPGDVEIHQNGIRWQSSGRPEHRADILFSNIKNFFFQPCDNELFVILHVSLKNSIMVGKRKVQQLQFVREASEAVDETGNRRRKRYGDEDEIEMEQEERKQRARLNKEFRQFADKVVEAGNNRFDLEVPFRDLGFHGVPNRQFVLLQPTTYCLVYISDIPCFVVNLPEVEIAHLERIQFGLKNFDLVFVFSDLSRPPVHVNSIPMEELENVKNWLDSADIPFSEGQLNLNWPQIMKTVTEDPYDFYKEGGWGFLRESNSESESEGEESEGSAFAPESDGSDEEDDYESEESASEDSDEDFDEDDDDLD